MTLLHGPQHPFTPPIADTGSITHRGPVAGVQVHAHMEFGPYALTVPLDTKVVIQLMFMFAEQTRQGSDAGLLRVTPLTLLERLRELGVVSGNGSRLVGRDAVYESFARLQQKGYIRRLDERDEAGRRTQVAYEFYDWPSWNPDVAKDPISDSGPFQQVKSTSGNAGSGNAGSDITQKHAKSRSQQVKSTSGIAGSGNAGSGNADSTFPQVTTTSGNAGHPPHPPEEVNTSSPSSPTEPSRSLPSQMEEEGESFAPKDLHAAESFLQKLTPPHHMGAVSARKYAPLLLQSMGQQGWPSIFEVDRGVLAQELTRDPEGFKRPSSLVPTRIRDLARYEVIAAAGRQLSSPGSGRERCPVHPARYRKGCLDCAMAVPA
ncbi:hypothetical protein ACJ6WF_49340 [Streptomyces sp. MMS24-I2-30]|uniref:hypothetical protein n=1 Tax=Streptomyces sp. MMS24-I2-30 TaxID=3351564 RepID=UPI003896B07E